MANDNQGLETPSFGNFSIESTLEMGNQELVNDLFAPETASADPTKVSKIEPSKKEEKKVTSQKDPLKKDEESKKDEEPKGKTLEEQLLEEEEEKDPETKKDEKDSDPNEETDDNQLSALAKDLFKLNVFTKEEDEEEVEIKTPEEFLERFNLEKRKGANEMIENFIGKFGEDYQNAFQAIFVKGVDPKEYYSTYNNIENYAEMDLSVEANQEAVVRQFYTNQGLQPEVIKTKIEKLKNYGDLADESKNFHEVLVKKEAEKLQQLEQQKEEELNQKAAVKQQYFRNVQTVLQDKLKAKEFDGIPLNPKQATELQDFLLVDKWKTASGETLTDFDRTILDLKRPENHEKKVKVALLLKLLETDPTLSTIQKTGVTKKTDKLFSEVARTGTKTSVKSGKEDTPSRWSL